MPHNLGEVRSVAVTNKSKHFDEKFAGLPDSGSGLPHCLHSICTCNAQWGWTYAAHGVDSLSVVPVCLPSCNATELRSTPRASMTPSVGGVVASPPHDTTTPLFNAAKPPHRPRSNYRVYLCILVFIVGMISLFISMGLQLRAQGPPPGFFEVFATNSVSTGAWCAAFFELAVVLSLAITFLLAEYGDVRRVAGMGFLLAAFLAISLAFLGSLLRFPGPYFSALRDTAHVALFYLVLAECADGTIAFGVAELIMYSAFAIALGQADPGYRAGRDFRNALESSANWERALFFIYFIAAGFLRAAALHACMQHNAKSPLERWWYRTLIVIYLALFWSVFAFDAIVRTSGIATANLYDNVVFDALLYSFVPLTLVAFMSLSRTRSRELRAMVDAVTAREAAAEAATQARREYLGYVFHEVRVPFSALVLGLESLSLRACESGDVEAGEEVALMRASAGHMQQVLNDTLELVSEGICGCAHLQGMVVLWTGWLCCGLHVTIAERVTYPSRNSACMPVVSDATTGQRPPLTVARS